MHQLPQPTAGFQGVCEHLLNTAIIEKPNKLTMKQIILKTKVITQNPVNYYLCF